MSVASIKRGDLTSIKRGDDVMVTEITGACHRRTVTAAGPAWITVGRTRYHRCDGRIEGGVGLQRIETLEAYDIRQRGLVARRQLHLWGLDPRSAIPLDKLEAIVAAIRPILELAPCFTRAEGK